MFEIYLLSLEHDGNFYNHKNFRKWKGNTGCQLCVNRAIIQYNPLQFIYQSAWQEKEGQFEANTGKKIKKNNKVTEVKKKQHNTVTSTDKAVKTSNMRNKMCKNFENRKSDAWRLNWTLAGIFSVIR